MKNKLYTTQLGAGLGLVNETRVLLELWESGMRPPDLLKIALNSGVFPNVTARRMRNIVAECFAPRYLVENDYPANVLKQLKTTLSAVELNQLLFLCTARANLVFYDFIREVYWSRYSGGCETLSHDNAREFVVNANREGKTTKFWSESMIKRVSSYLVGCCADFGLVENTKRSVRKILPFRLEPKVAAFIAYELHFSGLGDNSVLGHRDWELFGLQPEDVKDELKQLALKGLFIFQSAGDIIRISWNFNSWEELIRAIAEG